MRKKGQITLFIIIGLLVLFSTGLIFYMQSAVDESASGDELSFLVPVAPVLAQPIQEYVDTCVERIAVEALIEVGKHGGYIDIDDTTYDGGVPLKTNEFDQTDAEALRPFPGTGNGVALWYYMDGDGECLTCNFDSKMPPLFREYGSDSVEVQIDNYIAKHFDSCIDGFSPFMKQGYQITEKGQPIFNTLIAERDVQIRLEYPLEISKETSTVSMEKYLTRINLDLQTIFGMAMVLTEAQSEVHFLEKNAMNLISAYSGLDGPLPPIGESEFQFGSRKTWLKSEVKESYSTILETYVPMLQVFGTANYEYRSHDDPLVQAVYNSMVLPIGIDFNNVDNSEFPFAKIKVDFTYLSLWGLSMEVHGRGVQGEMIGPETMSVPFIDWMGVARYTNYYDTTFPVMVTIEDPNAWDGRGYTFRFALEANVRRNNDTIAPDIQLSQPSTVKHSLFCKENQKNSGEIEIVTEHAISGNEIDGVELFFNCGESTCYLGKTAMDERNRDAVLVGKLPLCLGGMIIGVKEGHHVITEKLSTQLDVPDRVTVGIYEEFDLKANLQKLRMRPTVQHSELDKNHFTLDPAPMDLGPLELALMTLEKVKETPAEKDVIKTFALYGKTDDVGYDANDFDITLVPGEYNVSIDVFYLGSVIVPEREECSESLFGDECQTIPEIFFNGTFPKSGVNFMWNVQHSDLYDANEITFYTVTAPDGFTLSAKNMSNLKHNALELVALKNKYSLDYRNNINPNLKR